MRKLLATKHNWKYPKSLQEAAFKKGRMNSALSVHRRLCKNPLIQIQDISGLDKPNFVCYTEETGQQLDGFSHPRQSSPHMPHSSLVSRRQRLRKSNPNANFRVRIFSRVRLQVRSPTGPSIKLSRWHQLSLPCAERRAAAFCLSLGTRPEH